MASTLEAALTLAAVVIIAAVAVFCQVRYITMLRTLEAKRDVAFRQSLRLLTAEEDLASLRRGTRNPWLD